MTGKHHQQSWWRLGALWWRLGGRQHPTRPPLGHLAEMVDGTDESAHLITQEAYAQGLQDCTGFYTVLCGRRIPVASMAAPPRFRCLPCHALGGRS